MEWYEFFDIAERDLEILNPCTAEKLLAVGKALGLKAGDRIIDFGCGYAEMLVLFADAFGTGGIGIDVRENACRRAREKLARRGLADRIEIVCAKGAECAFPPASLDAATCIGATFVFGGWRETLRALRAVVRPGRRVAVGEVYWAHSAVPPQYANKGFPTQAECFSGARAEGFEVEAIFTASRDDWDRYSSANFAGFLRWLDENPAHPERQAVLDRLHQTQDEYAGFEREFVGWAIYVLAPASHSGGAGSPPSQPRG